MATTGRFLAWDGCFNVRDLGGPGRLAPGTPVRADRLGALTGRGWTAPAGHGVRTVVDLRNDDERGVDHAPRPAWLKTVRVPSTASGTGTSGTSGGAPRVLGPPPVSGLSRNASRTASPRLRGRLVA